MQDAAVELVNHWKETSPELYESFLKSLGLTEKQQEVK